MNQRIGGVFLPWALTTPAAATGDAPSDHSQPAVDQLERVAPASTQRPAFRPFPVVPLADRAPADQETLLRLAVALDVMSLLTQSLTAEPSILQQLAEKLAEVGRLGGIDTDCFSALVDHAHSVQTAGRSTLSEKLSVNCDAEPILATPTGVALALRNIEAASQLVVKDATLLIDARAPLDLWQA